MSFLTALWLISLVLLVGIIVYARRKEASFAASFEEMPDSFADFIAIELTRMTGHLSRGATQLRPHGERVIAQSTVFLKKGHDIFIEKIFGRMEIEKGNVVSFFLKRITEHKESLRQKGRGKL